MSVLESAGTIPIEGPLPLAPNFGFFSVAIDLNDPRLGEFMDISYAPASPGGIRWEAGVTVRPFPTSTPYGFDPCWEPDSTFRVKEEGDDRENVTFRGFEVYLPDQCSGLGAGPWEEFKERANATIRATVNFAAERQFARGYAVDNRSLNDINLDVLGTSLGPAEGLARLENAIGKTGRAGVIHATPAVATLWSASRLLLWTGDQIRTVATRTPVIVGGGYIGTDPDSAASPGDVSDDPGAAPTGDTEWAFATGPVFGGIGELRELDEDIASTIDRAQNDLIYRAEQHMVVGWDGVLQVGVLIDRSATP